MSTETDDDKLFESIEQPAEVDAQSEPTPEEIAEREFDKGVENVLNGHEIGLDERQPALIAGLTEDQFKEIVAKANRVDELEEKFSKMQDKAFGTLGSLQKTINDLRNRPEPARGGKPNISKETFSKLAEYFDDESVAEALASDFANVQFEGGAAELPDIEERISQVEQKFELKLLDLAHADWREYLNPELGTPEKVKDFQDWRATLKPEALEVLDSSWDGLAMARAFDKFKEWRKTRGEAEREKQSRLENGILPQGGGRSAGAYADDAFNQGLKKVVAQRHR